MDFAAIFDMIANVTFTFEDVFYWIAYYYNQYMNGGFMQETHRFIESIMLPVAPFMPYIMLVLYAIVAFAGKRIIGCLKLGSAFVVGYITGVYYLAPLPIFTTVPSWILGLVVGVVAALLCKLLYTLSYIWVVGYGTYLVAYLGIFLPEVFGFAIGNALSSLIVADVVLVLSLIFKKWIEMAGTANLGAWGIAATIKLQIWPYTALPMFVGIEWVADLILIALVALIGFTVQVKTRKRY